MAYRKRPEVLEGKTYKIETGCGKLYVTVNLLDGNPFEVFVQLGKAGGCAASQTQATGRMISLALRNGIELKFIIKQLIAIGCHKAHEFVGGAGSVLSCSDAVAKVLKQYLIDEKDAEILKTSESH